jgi:DNA-binding beta-propeller fold protein YncE
MKKHLTLIFFSFLALLNSCSLFNSADPEDTATLTSGNGIFIVNEGNYNAGNGSLSFFSFDSMKIYNDLFSTVNNRPLGDIPYSIGIKNGKAYIVVNNSGKIEVVDVKTMKSTATITGLNSPRNILFVNSSKAYVTSIWSNYIAVIDLVTNKLTDSINLRRSSEAVIQTGSRAFAACWVSGKEIMEINTLNNRLTDSVQVGHEPESMVIDSNGKLWVLCSGGYSGEYYPELDCISLSDFSKIKSYSFPTKTEYPSALTINSTGDTLYWLNNGIFRMAVTASSLPATPLVASSGRNFYKLGISRIRKEIYATNTVDYQQKGWLLRFTINGQAVDSARTDIIPGNIYFTEN